MTQTLNPYDKYLDGKSPVDVLAQSAATLQAMVAKADATHLTRQPAPGKWSVSQILSHLADCELVFAFRLRQTVAEDNPTIQPFDQDKWASHYSKFAADEALNAFTTIRAWNLAFIRATGPTALDRKVTHPERGTMTFSTILETMAGHDLNHMHQVESLLD